MATIAEMLGKVDVVEKCRKKIQGEVPLEKSRISAEIILKDGTRRLFRCRSLNRKRATIEVVAFVEAIERATEESVIWRFRGEKMYQMGSNLSLDTPDTNRIDKLKNSFKRLLGELFELD